MKAKSMRYRASTPKRNPWPAAKRARMAQIIKRNRPWRFSTGPRTAKGKAITAQNATKHSRRSTRYRAAYRQFSALLRHQKTQMRILISPKKNRIATKSPLKNISIPCPSLYAIRL